MANKHKKKHHHQQGHVQGRKVQDQQPVHLTAPVNSFLDVDVDMDNHLPSRDTSTVVSHSSIYLNSQQIAQETEDMGKEWSINMDREDVGWEGKRGHEDKGQESDKRTDRQDYGNISGCTQIAEIEANNNISQESVQHISQISI